MTLFILNYNKYGHAKEFIFTSLDAVFEELRFDMDIPVAPADPAFPDWISLRFAATRTPTLRARRHACDIEIGLDSALAALRSAHARMAFRHDLDARFGSAR